MRMLCGLIWMLFAIVYDWDPFDWFQLEGSPIVVAQNEKFEGKAKRF